MKQAAKRVLALLGVALMFASFAFVQVYYFSPAPLEASGQVKEETSYEGADRHRRLEAGLLLSSANKSS